jgi:biopolymer transport protein ExbB
MDKFLEIMHKGGPVLWVLLVMSVFTFTLVFERAWFWIRTHRRERLAMLARVGLLLRQGETEKARLLIESDDSIYGGVLRPLLAEGYSEEAAIAAIEGQRYRFERSMNVLSAMISGAPLLGLLGTVTGLITTFRLMSDQMTSANPASVGLGLSEALFNTAAGLIVALTALFPYTLYRTQVDRALGRMESLVADASRGHELTLERANNAQNKPSGQTQEKTV